MLLSTVIAASCGLAGVLAISQTDHCSTNSVDIAYRTYCAAVDRLVYESVGKSGSYTHVTGMPSSGHCSFVEKSFSGPLAPFDEDLSIHFRGPIVLKQFAVYMPSENDAPASKVKRTLVETLTVTDVVTETDEVVIATIPGGTAYTYTTTLSAVSACSQLTEAASLLQTEPGMFFTPGPLEKIVPQQTSTPSIAKVQSVSQVLPSASTGTSMTGTSAWQRIGHYNSDDLTAEGIVFLNNKGGQGSGVWDTVYGNSLSYANADSSYGATSPTVFGGTLNTNHEFGIFSNISCTEETCGFWRPGAVAYEGFSGKSKLFIMQFTMPHDSTLTEGYSGETEGDGSQLDVPAIWFLNAQIPRVGQYLAGPPILWNCTCWPSCGEFDIMEVLTNQTLNWATSTLHVTDGDGIGPNDYFTRPDGPDFMTLAVLMDNDDIIIQVIPGNFTFSAALTSDQIVDLQSNTAWGSQKISTVDLSE